MGFAAGGRQNRHGGELLLKPNRFSSPNDSLGGYRTHPPVVRHFFITLQQDLHEWISLGPTKTGMVYRLKGHAVERHE